MTSVGLDTDRSPQLSGHRLLAATSVDSATLPGGSTIPAWLAASILGLLLTVMVFVVVTARAQRLVVALAESRAAEQAASTRVQLLTTLLGSISEGVIVVNPEGKLLYSNSAAAPIIDDGAQPFFGTEHRSRFPVYHPDGSTPFPADDLPLTQVLQHGQVVERAELTVAKAGRLTGAILSVSAHPMDDHHGMTGAVAVFRDITSRMRYQAILLAQQQELRDFTGVVAHDLKAPLAGVGGFAEIMYDDQQSNPAMTTPQAAKSLQRIIKGVQRMDHLIDNLLAYATASDSALKPERVDLQQIITDVTAERTAHLLAGDRANGAAAALPPAISTWPLSPVYADPAMMRQLFDNLIGNALKFAMPNEPARINITARPEADNRISVEISDRGVGIPASQHDKVFTQFHRSHTNGAYPGTGLGLAICERIVERHGGTITVTDNPGGGCRFQFTLTSASDAHP